MSGYCHDLPETANILYYSSQCVMLQSVTDVTVPVILCILFDMCHMWQFSNCDLHCIVSAAVIVVGGQVTQIVTLDAP